MQFNLVQKVSSYLFSNVLIQITSNINSSFKYKLMIFFKRDE